MQGKQALNLCLYVVIHKRTTKLPSSQIDILNEHVDSGPICILQLASGKRPLINDMREPLTLGKMRYGGDGQDSLNSHSAQFRNSVLQ